MSFNIECQEKEAFPVLSMRTRTPVSNLPSVLGEAYDLGAKYITEQGGEFAFAPFVAYYNMDMNDLDVEIGFPVKQALPGKGTIQPGVIPAGKQVTCFYKGPYEGLQAPYDAMAQWMKEKGLEPVGTSYEFYLNDPQQVPPEALETIIMFPVK